MTKQQQPQAGPDPRLIAAFLLGATQAPDALDPRQALPPQAGPLAGGAPVVMPGAELERSARSRRRSAAGGWGDVPFHLAALALSVALWAAGGFFTLAALQGAGLPVVARLAWPWELAGPQLVAYLLSWLIPAGVSALELGFERRRGWGLIVFLAVAGFDLITTAIGLYGWGLARGLAVETVIGLGVLGATAFALTFLPERIAGYCVRELRGLLS